LEIAVARITPHTGGKCKRHGKKKTSMIESAQTALEGIKENSQSSKVSKQSLGA